MAEGPGTLALVPQQAPLTGNSPKDVRIGRYPVQRNRLPSKVCSTSFALGAMLFSSSAYTFTTYRACRSCTANHFRQRPPSGLGESPPVHCPVHACSQCGSRPRRTSDVSNCWLAPSSQTVPISKSVPHSGKPKECCGGVAVEQERLQGLWPSALGALTPGLGILVLLPLDPEGHSNVDNGRDNEVR